MNHQNFIIIFFRQVLKPSFEKIDLKLYGLELLHEEQKKPFFYMLKLIFTSAANPKSKVVPLLIPAATSYLSVITRDHGEAVIEFNVSLETLKRCEAP